VKHGNQSEQLNSTSPKNTTHRIRGPNSCRESGKIKYKGKSKAAPLRGWNIERLDGSVLDGEKTKVGKVGRPSYLIPY